LGIRETINRNSVISTTAVVCMVVVGAVVIGLEIRGNDGKPPSKNYFTTDDGQTWFADSTSKLPPFDHDGVVAVRCYVFQGKNGKFAGLLEKYSDGTRNQLAGGARLTSIPVLVKKPGEKEWENIGSDQEARILTQISGRGDSAVEIVMP
jgi:hypothetical protein